MKPILVSGIQSTGTLHLGNYLGALKQWVDLQDKYQCFYFIADLHAITIEKSPAELTHDTDEAIKDLLACGIDPTKSVIFVQSHLPPHTELAWILNTLTPISELERMTQFKDKSGILDIKDIEQKLSAAVSKLNQEVERFKKSSIEALVKKVARQIISLPKSTVKKVQEILETEINPLEAIMATIDQQQEKLRRYRKQDKINAGLFDYPVLMAADILLYKAQVVPVGDDQLQHVELTRLLAKKFNHRFGEYFPEPAAKITEAKRVMSLSDPSKKMSKSHGAANYLALYDEPAVIREKIKKAVTDTSLTDAMSPGVRNLFDLLKYCGDRDSHAQLLAEYQQGTLQYLDLKEAVAVAVNRELKPIREKRAQISAEEIKQAVRAGYETAHQIAEKNIREIKKLVGFRPR